MILGFEDAIAVLMRWAWINLYIIKNLAYTNFIRIIFFFSRLMYTCEYFKEVKLFIFRKNINEAI